jgi:hypothetical protein
LAYLNENTYVSVSPNLGTNTSGTPAQLLRYNISSAWLTITGDDVRWFKAGLSECQNDINATIALANPQTYGCCGITKTELDVRASTSAAAMTSHLSRAAVLGGQILSKRFQSRSKSGGMRSSRRLAGGRKLGDFSQSPIETTVTSGTEHKPL